MFLQHPLLIQLREITVARLRNKVRRSLTTTRRVFQRAHAELITCDRETKDDDRETQLNHRLHKRSSRAAHRTQFDKTDICRPFETPSFIRVIRGLVTTDYTDCCRI